MILDFSTVIANKSPSISQARSEQTLKLFLSYLFKEISIKITNFYSGRGTFSEILPCLS